MTATVLERPPEAEWLQWRLQGITASDVAAASTGSYGGAYTVVAKKLGIAPPTEVTDEMRRGLRWEPRIASLVEAATGLYVVGEQTCWEAEANPLHRCTLDGGLTALPPPAPPGLVGEWKTRGRDVTRNLPYWTVQVQWQMYVTGIPGAVIADCRVDDSTDQLVGFHPIDVEADRWEQRRLVELADWLWDHVQAGTLPAPDTESALETVKSVWTVEPSGDDADLSDLIDEVARIHGIDEAVKAAKKERQRLEALVRNEVGAAPGGTAGALRVGIATPTRILTPEGEQRAIAEHPEYTKAVLDVDLMKTEAPDLYDSYRERRGARRMTVTPVKGTR